MGGGGFQIKSRILKGNSTGKQLNPQCRYHGGCAEVPALPLFLIFFFISVLRAGRRAAKSPLRQEKGGGAKKEGDGRGNELLCGFASLCYASV